MYAVLRSGTHVHPAHRRVPADLRLRQLVQELLAGLRGAVLRPV